MALCFIIEDISILDIISWVLKIHRLITANFGHQELPKHFHAGSPNEEAESETVQEEEVDQKAYAWEVAQGKEEGKQKGSFQDQVGERPCPAYVGVGLEAKHRDKEVEVGEGSWLQEKHTAHCTDEDEKEKEDGW